MRDRASARGACALGPPWELEGGLEACPGEGSMRNRQGRAGREKEEGLDHWGGADVGGMAAAEAEGTSGAGCLLGTTRAFPVAPRVEDANTEFRGGPHCSLKQRLGGVCTGRAPSASCYGQPASRSGETHFGMFRLQNRSILGP